MRPLAALLLALAACSSPDPEPAATAVSSHLSGRVVLADTLDVDASRLRASVLDGSGAAMDTLASFAVDADGAFGGTVTAPERGVYPLVIHLDERPLALGDLVVAQGDSASVTAPLPGRPMRVRSPENSGWMAYRNTRAQFDRQLEQVRAEVGAGADVSAVERRVGQAAGQTARVLWSLRESFAGTVGAEVAAAEAVALLEGVDDSLALAYAAEIEPENAGFATVARAARRAEARMRGQEAAVALLERMRDRAARPDDASAIQAEIVAARIDSLQGDAAAQAADALRRDARSPEWTAWAERARYEATHLLPGMRAPTFRVRGVGGGEVSLADLRGQVVVLEFFEPGEAGYSAEVQSRKALADLLRPQGVTFVTAAVATDTLLAQAFFDLADVRGPRVIVSEGTEGELPRAYNVHVMPVRFVIDRSGDLVGKYVGPALGLVQNDVLALLAQSETES